MEISKVVVQSLIFCLLLAALFSLLLSVLCCCIANRADPAPSSIPPLSFPCPSRVHLLLLWFILLFFSPLLTEKFFVFLLLAEL